jgi:putative oxidoreductase
MSTIAAVIGRVLIAAMFVVSGLQKIADPGPTAQMLTATNLPANLALPTGVFELVVGILLAIGLMTRLVSLVLFVFVGLTIFFFHNQFADPLQGTLALKNLAIMGGLLMTFAYGQVRGTFDYMRERRRTYDAELRAARAEAERKVRRRRRGPWSPTHRARRSPTSTATACPRFGRNGAGSD